MNDKKNERGITLIALIITIIILIVLSVIAIKSLMDTEIVNLSKDSAEKYASQQVQEAEEMGNTDQMLESAVAKIATNNGENSEESGGDTIQIDKSEYENMKKRIEQLESKIETANTDISNISNSQEYHKGDIVNMQNVAFHEALLSSSNTNIQFTINLDKKIGSDVSSVKVVSGKWRVRKAEGGYVIGYGTSYPTDNFSCDSLSISLSNNSVTFYAHFNTPYSSIPNNSILSVETYNFVLQFE